IWAAFSSWLTPASAYVRATDARKKTGLFQGCEARPSALSHAMLQSVMLFARHRHLEMGKAWIKARLFELLRKPVNVVISDLAPRLSGNRAVDVARSLELADAAVSFAARALRPRGAILVKVFQVDGYPAFVRRVSAHFDATKGVKPSSSSSTSSEIYVLAMGRI